MGGAIITTSLVYKIFQTPLQLRLLKEGCIYANIEKKTTLQKNLSEIHKNSTKQGTKSQIYDVQLLNFFSSHGIKFTTKIYWGLCLPLYPVCLANLQSFVVQSHRDFPEILTTGPGHLHNLSVYDPIYLTPILACALWSANIWANRGFYSTLTVKNSSFVAFLPFFPVFCLPVMLGLPSGVNLFMACWGLWGLGVRRAYWTAKWGMGMSGRKGVEGSREGGKRVSKVTGEIIGGGKG